MNETARRLSAPMNCKEKSDCRKRCSAYAKYFRNSSHPLHLFVFVLFLIALLARPATADYLMVTSRESGLFGTAGSGALDARAFQGDIVTSIGTSYGWSKVQLRNGVTGWIAPWTVSPAPPGSGPQPAFTTGAATPESPAPAWVVSQDVVFRTLPDASLPAKTDHTRSGTLPAGSQVWVTGHKGHWARLRFTSIYSGWVYDEALAPGPALPAAQALEFPSAATDDQQLEITFPTDRPTAFIAEPQPFLAGLTVFFFGIGCPVDQPEAAANRPYQLACYPGETAMRIDIPAPSGRLCGYEVYWYDGTFHIRLRRAPGIRPLTIVIDPGHGAPQPPPRGFAAGASTAHGVNEKDINLDIALRLRDVLSAAGHNVQLTRESDSLDMLDLYRRVDFTRQIDPDLFISIHGNGDTNRGVSGSEVYWFDHQSQPFASIMAQALGERTGRSAGKPLFGSFAVIRYTSAPAVLVETGYLTNAREGALLSSSGFRSKCAEAMARGVEEYVKYLDGN